MVRVQAGYLSAHSALHEQVIAPPRTDERAAQLHQSFLALYEGEAAGILRYLRAAVHDQADAEDLTAETFFRAWQAWPRFRQRDVPPRAWLYRIARNLVIDRSRRHRPVTGLPETLPDDRGDATSAVAVDRVALARALARVPAADRGLLLLRAAGLKHAEIGQVQGRSDKAVKVAWHRAMLRLRAQLEEGR